MATLADWPPETPITIKLKDKGGIYYYSNDFNVRWSIPAFKGYTGITCSSISMGGSIATSQDTGEAPFYIHCSASNVTCVGSRLNSALAVNPYEHLEHRWTVTKSDLSPCEYGNEITDPNSKKVVNPYTGQIGGEAAFLLREAGDYIITLVSTSANGTTNSIVKNITVSVPTYGHLWIDGAAGSESNDGLDPWGFSLTNASYTESTGELTEAGAFTSYDNAAATASVSTDNYNYIYVNGHGAKRIASKTSNDTIVLLDKLGSDLTGLTSSDGPKQILNTAKVLADTFTHLKGGLTYLIDSGLNPAEKDSTHIGGYGGTPTISPDALLTWRLYDFSISGARVQSSWISMHNVLFDCLDQAAWAYGGTNSTTMDEAVTITHLADRVTQKASGDPSGVRLINGSFVESTVIGLWGSTFDNLRVGVEPRGIGLYTEIANGFLSSIGCLRKADCDDSLLHHFCYLNGEHDNRLVTWDNYAEGAGANYCINYNCKGANGDRSRYITTTNNLFANANWGFDLSNGTNDLALSYFQDCLALGNSFQVLNGATLYFNAISLTMLYNVQFPTGNVNDGRLFISPGASTSESISYVLDGNQVSDVRLVVDTKTGNREVINNRIYNLGTAIDGMRVKSSDFTADTYFGNNQYYTPDNTVPIDDNGSLQSVATFDSANSFTNGTTNPQWLDPAVGDFF